MGELGQQPHCPMDDVIDVGCSGQERGDGPPLGAGQWLDGGQPVDEQAVSLVSGDSPGAGVRLDQVALVLQHRHVVADGGRGDVQAVSFHQRLGTDRLPSLDVVGDDGTQHLKLAIIHNVPPPLILALTCSECQS